ncbi:MAG: hypothetical protein KF709_02620 [Gemmatimonadaceae bacterium]|nr:hypothetical protein [Gemmatimonadaceae bacterium]
MLVPLRNKIGDFVASVIALRPKIGGGATTLTANAAAGAAAFTVASTTGLSSFDPLAVGSEEDAELVTQAGSPAGSTINLLTPTLKRAHVTGEAVRELEAWDLGNCLNVRRADSADVADNETDVGRNPDGRRLGHLMPAGQFDLQGYSPWHFALLTGMPLSRVLGAASQADPTQVHTDGTDFCSEETFIVLTGRKKDGTFLQHRYDACSADYTQIVVPFGQGREQTLAGRFAAANHGHVIEAVPNFLTGFTQQVRNAQRIEALISAGYFRVLSGGLSTTLTGATALDANIFDLTAATGVAGGKYYVVTGGGRSQIVLAQSLASLAMTVRTRAAYAFPAGSTVVELEYVPFAGLKEGTTEFRVGGSVRQLKFDNARVAAGHLAGSALFTMQFQPTALTLENLRLQRGLPTGAIFGDRLTESDLAGTDAPIGWGVTAQRKDTKTVHFIGSGVDNGLETLELMLSKNDVSGIPLTFRNQLLTQLMW